MGLVGTSLAWGPWQGAQGMTGTLSTIDQQRIARTGLLPLSADEGLALFDAALTTGEPVIVPAHIDPGALRTRDQVPALLQSLVPQPVRRRAASTADLARRLADLPAQRRVDELMTLVRGQVAMVLGHGSATVVDPDRAFTDLGFDSLTAVELRNRLATVTGLRLPATLVFDYPSARALAGFALADLAGAATGTGPVTPV